MAALRILIADDHAAVRSGIRTLIQSHAQWQVCGEAIDGKQAVELAARLKPDVVVLDLTMPELNGLEAARRIRREVPDARVVVLTMHEAAELAREVRRAGGHAVVVKSDAHQSLIRAIESLRTPGAPIRLADSVLDDLRHVAAFFRSAEERYRILGPFVAEGIANGEKALHIIDPPDRGTHVAHLTEQGVESERAEARGQLEFLEWQETYLRGGEFDQDAMLTLMGQLLNKGSTDGFPLTRAIAHMEWALQDRPGVADLVQYEVRVNSLLRDCRDVVLCAYDLTKFSGDVIIDVMRGHPVVLIGGCLRENPFYAPQDLSAGMLP